MVIKLSAYPEFKAGTHAHPSHPGIMNALGEDQEAAYKAIMDKPQVTLAFVNLVFSLFYSCFCPLEETTPA